MRINNKSDFKKLNANNIVLQFIQHHDMSKLTQELS